MRYMIEDDTKMCWKAFMKVAEGYKPTKSGDEFILWESDFTEYNARDYDYSYNFLESAGLIEPTIETYSGQSVFGFTDKGRTLNDELCELSESEREETFYKQVGIEVVPNSIVKVDGSLTFSC